MSPETAYRPHAPLESAVALLQISRSLQALAEEGQPPAQVDSLRGDLLLMADGFETAACARAGDAERSWDMATGLLRHPELFDRLGERHRVISDNALSAALTHLAGRDLRRAARVLAELAGHDHRAPGLLLAAAELVGHAAALVAQSAAPARHGP